MKKLYHSLSKLVIPFCLIVPGAVWGQDLSNGQISGQVIAESDEPLAGATIIIKSTYQGTSTNSEGNFVMPNTSLAFPLTLSVSYVGFQTQLVTVAQPGQALTVTLVSDRAAINQVVVAASRQEENILRVPVTVEKVTRAQISQSPYPDLLQSLAQFKGIDLNANGMLRNSISTRGFNSPQAERLVQLVDYFDTQTPSFSSTSGNIFGLPDIDVASIEVLYGASSALYGANAFNGVVLLNSRDAFTDQGLDVRLRGGQRDYFDGQLRYAQSLGKRWAIKLTGSFLSAQDWVADTYDAQKLSGVVQVNNPTGSSLGYDAVNRYGDVGNTYRTGALAGKTVFMPGWTERELLAEDSRVQPYRVVPSISYLVTDKVKATVQYERAEGNASVQTAVRARARAFATDQYRFALQGERWFVRALQTQEVIRKTSYNLGYLGSALQGTTNPDTGSSYTTTYFNSYEQAYNRAYSANGGNEAQAQAAAQAATASLQLDAGSQSFKNSRQTIIDDATPGTGGGLRLNSRLRDLSAQYNFGLGFADLIVGGAYRQYHLDNGGSQFVTDNGRSILNYEYGGYAQLSKTLLQDQLKLAVAGRLDNFKNFDPAFSPRASAVYSLDADQHHNFRASYSRAFRSPTQYDQYANQELNTAVIRGNVGAGVQGYPPTLGNNLSRVFASANPAEALSTYAIKIEPLRLEQVNSYEVGYKGLLVKDLVLDLSYYHSYYRDFVVTNQALISNTDGSLPSLPQVAAAAPSRFQNLRLPTRIVVVSGNLDLLVRSQGALASVTYTASSAVNLTGNYSLNVLTNSESEVPFYNTPKHKFNVGVYGTLRHFGYRLNYHWAEAHRYYTSFADGYLSNQQSLDAQAYYSLPKLNTTLEVGGSNLLNSYNVQVYGGPQISQLIYAGVSVSIK